MGARPLGRVIQQEIKKALADKLLFGDLVNGGHVKVDIAADPAAKEKMTFEVTPSKEPPPKVKAEADEIAEGEDETPELPKEPAPVR